MATKKTATDTVATIAKTVKKAENPELKRIGERMLVRNPHKSEVYVCANGFAFFEYADAVDCAAKLNDSTITTIIK